MNHMGNSGYFVDDTYGGVIDSITSKLKELVSKELIEDVIVLRYSIDTLCSYMINSKGEIVPNGSLNDQGMNYEWKGGTIETHATQRRPYGFNVYVQPFRRQTYRYRSGKKNVIYEGIYSNKYEEMKVDLPNLEWLANVVAMEPSKDQELKDIIYNEKVGKFFVSLIKGICSMNERIKDFLDPESIMLAAHEGRKILGE